MLYAEIRWTGKIIAAAKASRYDKYRCPTCKAEVFLKAGRVYRTHFAHMPGRGRPECENYHPPEDLRRQLVAPSPQQLTQQIEGLLLSIELEPDHDARNGLRRWGLRVTVPKSYDPRGIIKIDLGGGDIRTVTLSKLFIGGQTYRADLAAVEFRATWVSSEVLPMYSQAVVHPIAGLNPLRATVFDAAPQKLKPHCYALRWGESYYFVWRGDRYGDFPPSLPHHALANNRGWTCCLLTLPDRADPDIAAWLEKTCDLQISPAKREWTLIHPSPYCVDDDGQLKIHYASTLLLAIKSIDDSGEITCVSGQQLASLELSDSGRHIVEISVRQQATQWPIHLSWDSLPLNSLSTLAYPDSAPEPAVVFEFDQIPEQRNLALHQGSCLARLRRVRTTDEQVTGIKGDYRICGKLRHRRVGEFEWQVLKLNFPKPESPAAVGLTSLPSAQIEHLNILLKDCSLVVAIDFGPYGMFLADALATEETARPRARLPRQLRSRIEWLCKSSQAFVDTKRRFVNTLDDAELLRHLSTLKIPVELLANQRALERDLRRIETGLPT